MSRIRIALCGYVAMAALAGLIAVLAERPDLYHQRAWLPLGGAPWSTLASLVLGLAVAFVVVRATRALLARTRWAQSLSRTFEEGAADLDATGVMVLAVGAGVSEELLFRGALQPSLGVVGSALAFALLHVGPGRRYIPWTVSALVLGLVLGLVTALTGELLGAVVAHVVINFENLQAIRQRAVAPSTARARLDTPKLLVRRTRL